MLDLELRQSCVNTIRFLAADAVEKAKSGHPGAPMGMADMAFVLWNQFLRYDPDDPQWPNRDRFVLSAGHASMLLYSLLHLAGYKLTMEDIQNFRQWKSLTPGHPEYGLTPGVECTTGPLGSGFSNAAGMALGAKMMGARFNSSKDTLIDSRIFVLCSDGDMQEGIASETASLAGHLGLGNLIALYDSNDITIAGDAGLAMSEDVGRRFEAYGWHVQHCDGHNHDKIAVCLEEALRVPMKPSLIVAKTIIGKGAPTKEGTAGSHGAPLGADEIRSAKQALGWEEKPDFYVPDEVREVFEERKKNLKLQHQEWEKRLTNWKKSNPELAELWDSHWDKKLPDNLLNQLIETIDGEEDATRNLSGKVIQKMAELIPSLVGGSADLEPSNKTLIKSAESIRPASSNSNSIPDPSFSGRNIHFGIREHAMGGITNGLALYGAWRPFCGTFAVFSDFMRPSVRLAAISKLSSIFVFTHDSYGVGEDGPTHQPVEQLWALRLIPELEVWRPADAIETAAAWNFCLQNTNDLRKTRSAVQSIIPVDTELARGIERILPELAGRFEAQAVRVPTVNVSAMDISILVEESCTADTINEAIRAASEVILPNVLGYTDEPLASCDFNHDPRSAVVDLNQTRVASRQLVKLLVWFDNEWAYANRMLDVAQHLANLHRGAS